MFKKIESPKKSSKGQNNNSLFYLFKTILAFLFFTPICLTLQGQTTIFSENFSTGSGSTPPSGWTNNIAAGGVDWRYDNPSGRSINAPFAGQFAIFESRGLGTSGVNEDGSLESPTFDASAYSSLTLTFDHRFRQRDFSAYSVDIYNGTSWVSVLSGTTNTGNPDSESIDITTTANSAVNAQVRFRYTGERDRWWAVDNVVLTGTPVLGDLDTDGDGIFNLVDLDDDNDGIIDLEECTTSTQLFNYTGSDQFFTIPTGPYAPDSITFKIWGAGGSGRTDGGGGGYTEATFKTSDLPSTVLIVTGGGGAIVNFGSAVALGGYGGGGDGGTVTSGPDLGPGGGGGGLSGIFDAASFASATQTDALAIAGGGGGGSLGGVANGYNAGAGGGTLGEDAPLLVPTSASTPGGGTGGTQLTGGVGFQGGTNGTALQGGTAASGKNQTGGGGGGGYFGGGGGGWENSDAVNVNDSYESPGGGGSGYLNPLATYGVLTTGAGSTPANTADTDYIAGIGRGDNGIGVIGGNGLVVITFKSCLDSDGDGVSDDDDIDSDNDGISDIVEAGGIDSYGDGQIAYATPGDPTTMVDADSDGLEDSVDNQDSGSGVGEVTSGTPLAITNTDGLGNPNYLDIDSDDDGIVDNTEAQATVSYISPSGNDDDGDGLDDAYDIDCAPCGGITGIAIFPVNSDPDVNPDYIDTDTDNDAINDDIEGHDTNGDGVVNGSDSPAANTGLSGGTTDADNDGLLDGFDNNTSSFDPTNNNLNPNSHPNAQGGLAELDWREIEIITDTDGDNIADYLDQDDDNDGILDCVEKRLANSAFNEVFTINGDAVQITSTELQVTDAINSQTGSAFANDRIDFNQDFSFSFEVNLGNDDSGADGLAIVFHNDPAGSSAIGGAGSGLAANGISDGIVLEVDTYDNGVGAAIGDIGNDHTMIWDTDNQAGAGLLTTAIGFSDLEDGAWRTVSITWDATSQNISYTLEGVNAGSFTGDLVNNYFDGENLIYFGFTGSTGGLNNDQRIRFASGFCGFQVSIDDDNDGIENHLDLDSDNDGIYDADEAGHGETHTNGRLTGAVGANGYVDILETSIDNNTPTYTIANSDGGIYADFTQLDSDNDGCNDTDEEEVDDLDSDGIAGTGAPPVDLDGLVTSITYATPPNNFWQNSFLAGGNCVLDTDGDLIYNHIDIDDDNDGVLDNYECGINIIIPVIADGIEDNNYPLGYWDAEYFEGFYGITGSTFGITSSDVNGTGGAGSPTFHGEAFFSTNSFILNFDESWTNSENPTDPSPPSGYVGSTYSSTGSPHYSIQLNRTMDVEGTLEFGGPTFISGDDVIEVKINGTQVYFGANCCGAPNQPSSTAASIPFLQGDEVQIRYINIGGQGGFGGEFILNYNCNQDFDGDGIFNVVDLDSDNDGIWDAAEAGHNETITNGRITGTMGANGFDNALETALDNGIPNFSLIDSDIDGSYDLYELDADGDSCNDTDEESIDDSDHDGIAGTGTPTVDANGLVNSITYALPTANYWQNASLVSVFCDNDWDDDGIANTDDEDDDNDGILDEIELCGVVATATTEDITIEITFDNYPEETSWRLEDNSSTVLLSGGSYDNATDAGTTIFVTYPNALGSYTFIMEDSYGDGICCSY